MSFTHEELVAFVTGRADVELDRRLSRELIEQPGGALDRELGRMSKRLREIIERAEAEIERKLPFLPDDDELGAGWFGPLPDAVASPLAESDPRESRSEFEERSPGVSWLSAVTLDPEPLVSCEVADLLDKTFGAEGTWEQVDPQSFGDFRIVDCVELQDRAVSESGGKALPNLLALGCKGPIVYLPVDFRPVTLSLAVGPLRCASLPGLRSELAELARRWDLPDEDRPLFGVIEAKDRLPMPVVSLARLILAVNEATRRDCPLWFGFGAWPNPDSIEVAYLRTFERNPPSAAPTTADGGFESRVKVASITSSTTGR